MDWQLVASYFTVKSTDIFYSVERLVLPIFVVLENHISVEREREREGVETRADEKLETLGFGTDSHGFELPTATISPCRLNCKYSRTSVSRTPLGP